MSAARRTTTMQVTQPQGLARMTLREPQMDSTIEQAKVVSRSIR